MATEKTAEKTILLPLPNNRKHLTLGRCLRLRRVGKVQRREQVLHSDTASGELLLCRIRRDRQLELLLGLAAHVAQVVVEPFPISLSALAIQAVPLPTE